MVDKSEKSTCRLANGEGCMSIGSVNLPISVEDATEVVNVLVVPAVQHTLILGVDFWKQLGIVPDLRKGMWTFSSEENDVRVDSIQGERELTPEQREALQNLVNEFKPPDILDEKKKHRYYNILT